MQIDRFEDILRALREHPDWMQELRQLVLTEELLALPQRFTLMEARQDRFEERMDRLEERMDRLEERMDRFEERLAKLEGEAVERRYRRNGAGYFGRIARRVRLLPIADRDDLLDGMEDEGTLTDEEADTIRLADGIFSARRNDTVVYLVLEASLTVAHHDVRRAVDRAALLARSGTPTLALVAGEQIPEDVEAAAIAAGAYVVTNGSVQAPAA